MLGFIIGVVWLLVSVGNGNNFATATSSVSAFLFWWYLVTSVIVFFSIFVCQGDEVADEISERFLHGISVTKEQCLGAAIIAFIVSRFLIFYGLSFLNESSTFTELIKTDKFAVGAILLLLGAMFGISAMLPLMAVSSLQNRYQSRRPF